MIVYGHFEWDLREAAKNLTTYGVSFKEATTVFADQNCTVTQNGGSQKHAIGVSLRGRPLLVVHQSGPRVRILSAEPYDERAVRAKAEKEEQDRLEQQRLEQQRLEQEKQERAAAEAQARAQGAAERPVKARRRIVTPLPPAKPEAAPAPAPEPVAAPVAAVQVQEPKGDKPDSKRRRSSASSWRAAARALGQEPEASSPSRR